jgi:hypothetical protein
MDRDKKETRWYEEGPQKKKDLIVTYTPKSFIDAARELPRKSNPTQISSGTQMLIDSMRSDDPYF